METVTCSNHKATICGVKDEHQQIDADLEFRLGAYMH